MTCRLSGCNRTTNTTGTAKGLCRPHYRRLLRYGDPLKRGRNDWTGKTCGAIGCNRPAVCRGACAGHYLRILKHGSINPPAMRQLSSFTAAEDAALLDLPLEPRSRYVKRGYLKDCAEHWGRPYHSARSRLYALRAERARQAAASSG